MNTLVYRLINLHTSFVFNSVKIVSDSSEEIAKFFKHIIDNRPPECPPQEIQECLDYVKRWHEEDLPECLAYVVEKLGSEFDSVLPTSTVSTNRKRL